MNYTSISSDQQREMLETIGVGSVDDLFAVIPEAARPDGPLDVPPPASELELQQEIGRLAGRNRGASELVCFAGAGAYDHFAPAFIDQMISRGEFLTAYTPYQGEASQGSLQAFFEFQTQIARLTGLEIANASLYEGASATAEGVLLAINATNLTRVLVAGTLHPDVRAVIRTVTSDLPVEVVEVAAGPGGVVDAAAVREAADDKTACLVLGSPNLRGLVEDWEGCFAALKEQSPKALGVAVCNPTACALLKNPGSCGADIACGEGQPLGIPLQFGGPYLGFFTAKKSLTRKMPGRLVSETRDAEGRRTFSLALQTREQHIRGAKATSNVCTNQGLLALRSTMYMSAMGPAGIREVAERCWHKAHWLAARISELDGYELADAGGTFFHEFVVRCPRPAQEVIDRAKARGVLAGVAMDSPRLSGGGGEPAGDGRELLIAVTEKRTKAEMETLIEALREAAA